MHTPCDVREYVQYGVQSVCGAGAGEVCEGDGVSAARGARPSLASVGRNRARNSRFHLDAATGHSCLAAAFNGDAAPFRECPAAASRVSEALDAISLSSDEVEMGLDQVPPLLQRRECDKE